MENYAYFIAVEVRIIVAFAGGSAVAATATEDAPYVEVLKAGKDETEHSTIKNEP